MVNADGGGGNLVGKGCVRRGHDLSLVPGLK